MQPDIVTMSKIVSWLKNNRDELQDIPKSGPKFLDHSRETNFRALMSKDPDYIMSK